MKRRSLLKAMGLVPLATLIPKSVNAIPRSENNVVSTIKREVENELEYEFEVCRPEWHRNFKTYVALGNSENALAAAKLVVETPGSPKLNPLLIYGPVYMGKAHLADAIGNALRKKSKLIVHGEAMMSHLPVLRKHGYYKYDSLRVMREFHLNKFDVLILNLLGRKIFDPIEQKLYAEIISEVKKQGKQVIITLDGNYSRVDKLIPEFKSIITSGKVVEVKSPTLEQKKTMASHFAELNKVPLSAQQVEILAKKWNSFGKLEDKVIEADDVLKFWS